MEVLRPIPTSGTLTSSAKISAIYDKGKGALAVLDAITTNEKGEEVRNIKEGKKLIYL